MSGNGIIAWRNLRQYRRRLMPLLLITMSGCVVALTALGLVSQASAASQHRVVEGVGLRTIEIRPPAPGAQGRNLTTANLPRLTSIPHVTAVEPTLRASFGVKNAQVPGALFYATVVQDSRRPPVVQSIRQDTFPLGAGEVILPASGQGMDFSPLLGQTVAATYTRQIAEGKGTAAVGSFKVVALYDPRYADDGPDSAYADTASVVTIAAARQGLPDSEFLAVSGYSSARVIVDTSTQVDSVLQAIREAGFDAVSLRSVAAQLPQSLRFINLLGYVVVAFLIVFCIGSGLALARSFVDSRTREIGLLKALGFRRRRILGIFLLETGIAGLAAAVAGVLAGNAVSIGLMAVLRGREVFGVTMPDVSGIPAPLWSGLLIVGPLLGLLLGALPAARRASALPADTALRDW